MSVRATCRHCGFTWTGDRYEHCPIEGCHQTFASSTAGDAHRIGSYTDPDDPRRCRTPAELLVGGLWQGGNGVWHGEWSSVGKQRRRSAANPSEGGPPVRAGGSPGTEGRVGPPDGTQTVPAASLDEDAA